MPMTWTEPEIYLEHPNGVKVYHTYKDNDRRMSYWFTTDESEDDVEACSGDYLFDVRDLPLDMPPEKGESEDVWMARRITAAIEQGLLNLPDHNQPGRDSTSDIEARTHRITNDLESQGVCAEHLDELVHECKGAEAAAINNSGILEQVDYLLRNGVTWEQIKECIPQE